MSRPYHVPRPTEDAAVRRTRDPQLPPVEVLFDRMVFAYAVGDRHGLNLFGRQVVRSATGLVGEQP